MEKREEIIKIIVGFLILLSCFSAVFASSIPVYVKPLATNGSLNPNTLYSYVFNWSTDASCTNILFSNSTMIITGVDGIGFVNLSIPDTLATAPSYLCEYRNESGTLSLRAVHTISSLFSDKIFAKNFYGNGSGLNSVNASYLGSYAPNFFMPLNTSVVGNFDFNGGWTAGGLSIVGGNLFTQTLYTYNLSELNVTSLNINGSLFPYNNFDNQFDIGSATQRWKDIYLGGGSMQAGQFMKMEIFFLILIIH